MTVKRWFILRANLDPVIDSEQGKSRPVLVISEDVVNDNLNVVNVIPITSRKNGRKIYPNEVLIPANNYGLSNDSIIMCHQIRTVDKRRLSAYYGQITSAQTHIEIIDALCFQLGINL